MKKFLLPIGLFIVMVSLCSCGVEKNTVPTDTTVSMTTEETILETTECPYTEVEITLDNWQDYFVVTPKVKWQMNAFDEAERLNIENIFEVKDEYKNKFTNLGDTKIDIKTYYRIEHYNCDVDFDAMSFNIDKDTYVDIQTREEEQVTTVYGESFDIEDLRVLSRGTIGKNEEIITCCEDFKILNIQGTIYVLNK